MMGMAGMDPSMAPAVEEEEEEVEDPNVDKTSPEYLAAKVRTFFLSFFNLSPLPYFYSAYIYVHFCHNKSFLCTFQMFVFCICFMIFS